MPDIKTRSTNPLDYEILIRKRGDSEYSSYCPQLMKMFGGTAHVEVHDKMKEYIDSYIQMISSETENES
ncbi:MAG: hypothetical protein NT007_13635 [Candidatus Kapabacteria bacterium]|nr:hypothetical protein [Candidatus Kapabacteria bacterium]